MGVCTKHWLSKQGWDEQKQKKHTQGRHNCKPQVHRISFVWLCVAQQLLLFPLHQNDETQHACLPARVGIRVHEDVAHATGHGGERRAVNKRSLGRRTCVHVHGCAVLTTVTHELIVLFVVEHVPQGNGILAVGPVVGRVDWVPSEHPHVW